MNATDFKNLYKNEDYDDLVAPFENEIGFSVIRQYPKTTSYYSDGLRMFIKIAILKGNLFYSIDMTKPEGKDEKTEYIIQHDETSHKVTNFLSDNSDPEFAFDASLGKIIHIKNKKEFTLNEFINILEKNHLSDCLFWKRKLNWFVNLFLRLLFWLSDRKYDEVKTPLDRYYFEKEGKPIPEAEKSPEPFFKYFHISKNFIFTILLLSFFGSILVITTSSHTPSTSIWENLFGDFSLSNPFVVLLFFLALFSSEKASGYLNNDINTFLMPEKSAFSEKKVGFTERLHNYLYRNKFNLKV